jgi:sugar lactone lactonase YvrE
MRRWLVVLLALAFTALPVGTETASAAPEKWTTRVFAQVPAPGRPAYVHAHTNGRVYAANYEAGDTRRSRVFEWSAGGALLRSWTVPGQVLDADHGVQVATQTHTGRLVLLETSRRAVLTLDPRTGRFRRVATLPAGSVPNYATWTPVGLVVTDYAQGVLWRVTRTGQVRRLFASPSLEGVGGFGTTGIAYRPRRHDLLITQQTAGDGAPGAGFLYSLPLRDGRPGALRTLWTSQPTDLPDGFGIGRSGRIYVANAGLTNQLVQLSPTGEELDRFPDAPLSGDNGSSIPFDTPCSATFLGTSVLVANQSAVQQDASHMAILRVEVGERGRDPYLPRTASFR